MTTQEGDTSSASTPQVEEAGAGIKSFDLVDNAAKLLGTVSAALLVASVIYDYAFFNALGLTLLEVPTSIQDHVRSALVWAPQTALGLLVVLGLYFAIFVVVRFDDPDSTDTPKPEKSRRWLALALVVGALLVQAVAGAMLSVAAAYKVGLFAWMTLLAAALAQTSTRTALRRLPLWAVLLLLGAPLLLLSMAHSGATDAEKMLREREPQWLVRYTESKEGKVQEIEVMGMRQFTHFVVVVDADGRPTIFNSDALVRVMHLEAGHPEGDSCDKADTCIMPFARETRDWRREHRAYAACAAKVASAASTGCAGYAISKLAVSACMAYETPAAYADCQASAAAVACAPYPSSATPSEACRDSRKTADEVASQALDARKKYAPQAALAASAASAASATAANASAAAASCAASGSAVSQAANSRSPATCIEGELTAHR